MFFRFYQSAFLPSQEEGEEITTRFGFLQTLHFPVFKGGVKSLVGIKATVTGWGEVSS